MNKKRRRLLIFSAVSLVVLGGTCISVHPSSQGTVVRPDGKPVSGAFVLYWYRGVRFNPVCSSSYSRPGSLVHTETDGSFTIPGAVHFHLPYPLQGWTRLEAMVYSVETHSGTRLADAGGLDRVTLEDHGLKGIDPAKWHDAANEALIAAHAIASSAEADSPKHDVPAGSQREFRRALRREWILFREKFGSRPYRPGDPRRWSSFADDALRALDALEAKAGEE